MAPLCSRMDLQTERQLIKLFANRVNFCLLYQGSRHGFSISSMQTKTEKHGSVIFLVFLESGTIMGGFLSIRSFHYKWQPEHHKDEDAFVFKVNQEKGSHFPVVDHRQAFTTNLSNGTVSFGECLKLEMKSDGCFVEVASDEVYGRTGWPEMKERCVDVEMHRVLGAEDAFLLPWRVVSWTEICRENLRKNLVWYKPAIEALTQVRVLLMGPVGAGKSSFINSIKSVLYNRVMNLPIIGNGSEGFTMKLKSYSLRAEKGGQPVALTLCDVLGLGDNEDTGLSLHDALAIVKGHVPEGYKFQTKASIQHSSADYCRDPALKDKIHCVLFVLDACRLPDYKKTLESTLRKLHSKLSDLSIPQLVLLTHVDQVGPTDVCDVYTSHKLREKMEEAAQLVSVPLSFVLPVKNYTKELSVDLHSDILLLSAAEKILHAIDDAFEDWPPLNETPSL